MRKRKVHISDVDLNGSVHEVGAGHVATVYGGGDLAVVTRRCNEIAAIPALLDGAQDLINRLDDKDLDPRQRAALRKLQRAVAKATS